MSKGLQELDAIDYKILNVLTRSSIISSSSLAKLVSSSREVVDYRIKKLESTGVIKNFVGVVNTSKLGYKTFNFLFELQSLENSMLEKFENFLINHSLVKFVSQTLGSWEYEVSVMAKDVEQLSKFLDQLHNDFAGMIKENNFHLRTKTFKSENYSTLFGNPIKLPKLKKIVHNSKHEIDDVDLKILNMYSENSKISVSEISKLAKLTLDKARYRLNFLKKYYVLGSKANIDVSKFGYNYYSVVLKINNLDKKNEAKLKELLKSMDCVLFSLKILGRWDLRLQVLAKNQEDFQNIIQKLREHIGRDLHSYEFCLRMKQLKRVSMPDFIKNKNDKKN